MRRLDEVKSEMERLVLQGGPTPEEYSLVDRCLFRFQQGGIEGFDELREILEQTLTTNSMQGFVYTKPHGYPGDYEIIDRIYTEWTSPDPQLKKWDLYFHQLAAARAVRNRKRYFHKILSELTHSDGDESKVVLNIGSGPGRDMYEFLQESGAENIHFDCVDLDANAVDYASKLCVDHLDQISFVVKNLFRFRPQRQYALIWSAGFFDYLPDEIFTAQVRRLYAACQKGGELVVGNFSAHNPSRPAMEFGEWVLQHRDEDYLIELAEDAEIDRKNISVGSEPEGVNLFLHLRKE